MHSLENAIMYFSEVFFEGILRRFLVWPSSMIWPQNLPVISLLRTIHEKEQSTSIRWLNLSRMKFFLLATIGQIIYYWFPAYIFPLLMTFSCICMINPDNIIIAQLTGYYGLGMGTLVFDWNTITQVIGSPILVPYWALINLLIGFLFFTWFFIPIIYYSNLWNFKNLPIAGYPKLDQSGGYAFFTADGNVFVPNLQYIFDPTYAENLPPVLYDPTTATASYLIFASLAALAVHTILYHGKEIFHHFRTSLEKRENDIHCTLMSKYKELPEWWYILLFVISFVLSALVCHYGEFMPWYYLFIAIPFTFVCLLPIGIVQATTTVDILPIFVARILGGVLFADFFKAASLMTFMVYAYQMQTKALSLILNLKFAHFLKISPRTLFMTQLSITIISVIIRYLITNYLLTFNHQLCDDDSDWPCPNLDQLTLYVAIIG
ncbi:unnamed protein product [Didymodactylos carnosus]|uniref:Uncharacterized protein n=1 Tax=Didymodactylos carnosus TaxID=1234261 RepID=A0A815JMA8_9BILA|nr:unnamed protein product [Didymodactylos carnosus]CAF1379782.1 unnamed protein product [Didymodactylos carnosus]CAF4052770.1 unnamed protein product [Didymodactylos carnosus]CAF4273394.1 unnamed protein product [Didymodactylos carnosus]